MRLPLLLCLGLLVPLVPTALAQEGEPEPTVLVIHDDLQRAWTFSPDTPEVRFPEVAFYPGGDARVLLRNEGALPHTFRTGTPFHQEVGVILPGQEMEFTLSIPGDDDFEARYWLDDADAYETSGWFTTFGILYGVPHCHGDLCPHDGHVMLEANITSDGVLTDGTTAWPAMPLKGPGYGMIMVRNLDDGPHALNVGGSVARSTGPIAPGDMGRIRFLMPEGETSFYWLDGAGEPRGFIGVREGTHATIPTAGPLLAALAVAGAALSLMRRK